MARARQKPSAGGLSGATSFIAYYRVSTARQGTSGLGLEAQQAKVADYIARSGGRLVASYQEVESGKNSARPELAKALADCRARGCTLLVAKLDRLARNTRFLLSIVEGSGEAGVCFADLPALPPGPMGKFFVTLMAAVAELEAGLISERTRSALDAARARGVKLGGTRLLPGNATSAKVASLAAQAQARAYREDLRPYVEAARAAGAKSLNQIGAALKARGVRAPNGGEDWHSGQVFHLLRSLARAKEAA
jgi:DNA invertase Pin-like site-specific DNA recombinase